MASASKPAPATHTVVLNLEKETANSVRYQEEVQDGKPPVLKTIYLPKWLAGRTASIKVTVELLN